MHRRRRIAGAGRSITNEEIAAFSFSVFVGGGKYTCYLSLNTWQRPHSQDLRRDTGAAFVGEDPQRWQIKSTCSSWTTRNHSFA